MRRMGCVRRAACGLMCMLVLLCALPGASAKTYVEWMEGYESGINWFGEDFAYDITDEETCWALLTRPLTVLDVPENEWVYPLDAPDGEKVNDDKRGGWINGSLAGVHVLGEDENGWTLIEGLDYYDRIIRGYVKTKLLKEVTPNQKYGVIIDKLTQQLYVFIDGHLFGSVPVSTGLVNDKQPYNETASGEYITGSWVGGFNSEGMICDMAIRFNGGDMMHQVPYNVAGDGSKLFARWEALLGTKASHGCVRVARAKSPEGLNQKWLWDNLKKKTKVLVWDDDGRVLPYPDDDLSLYYNPEGGQYYHADQDCDSVRKKFRPLTEFKYSELDAEAYASLTQCPSCNPVKRKSAIDEENRTRFEIVGLTYTPGQGSVKPTESAPEEDTGTAAPASSLEANNQTVDEDTGAVHHEVEIVILPAD